MQTINPNKAGLALGALLGVWHFMWALLVAVGWAQPLIDFIFWIHFIKPVYVIGPFNIGTALLLIVITFSIGYTVWALSSARCGTGFTGRKPAFWQAFGYKVLSDRE